MPDAGCRRWHRIQMVVACRERSWTGKLRSACWQVLISKTMLTDHLSGPGRAVGTVGVCASTQELQNKLTFDTWHASSP